jgi:hypothetical protein
MNDYKFLITLRLYLIILHYSIFVGYIYGYYKNYNIKDSLLISAIMGILTPFFIPLQYIIDKYVREDTDLSLEYSFTEAPLIVFKHLCSEHKKIKPQKFRG